MDANERTNSLLDAAVDLATVIGWDNLTRDAIADHAGVSGALVTVRLGNKTEMLRNVMRRAIQRRCVPVVAQGLARQDRTARKADPALKKDAAKWLACQ
ncbi:MAG: helix-turn-helix transcriptional regulator [Burkholderiaceae bacterium]|nr:helix-turn-helix transcriptional regulator [Burkholderiaceae bacterium]